MSNPILFPVRPKIGEGVGIGVGPLNPTILLDETQPPFYQLNWPNPQKKPYIITTIATSLGTDANIAFNQLDWPNPQPKLLKSQTWIQSFRPNDANIAFAQSDWPVPSPNRFKPYTWTQNLLENTLAPIVIDLPKNQYNWPNPARKPFILVDVSSTINPAPADKPQVQVDYPNPSIKRISALSWLQTRPNYYQDIKPFKQDDYPNPLLPRFKNPNTWISNKANEAVIDYMPCSVLDWPNPAPKRKIALTHISIIPQLQQLFTIPDSRLPIYPNRLDAKKSAITWIQARPFYYADTIQDPFKNVDWSQVPQRKVTLLTFNTNKLTVGTSAQNPFRQTDWPNPQRKKRLPELWEFWYQQDDNLPFVSQVLNLPVTRAARVPLTWIFRPLLNEVTTEPNKTFDYPNPILVKRQTNSWLYNLLQSTLDPGAGQKPFHYDDQPNPQIGKRNFHIGWIQNKPTYYTEQPLQPAQYDWPIFRSPKRNQTGYIQFIIPTETITPKSFTIAEVPVRKNRPTEIWLYSSLIDLTAVVGVLPFNQYDWPVFRPLRRNQVGYIQRKPIVIPDIVGRIICLDSAITEFDLESTTEDYDIDSGFTIFDLEAGGTECQ